MLKLQFEKAEIEVRNQLVNQFLIFLSLLSLLMVSASVYRSTSIGWQPFMTIHVIAGSLVVSSAIFRHYLSYAVKAWFSVVILLLVGLNSFYTLGLISSGHAFILMSITAAAAFLSIRTGAGLALIAISALIGLSIVWIHHKPISFDPYFYMTNPQSWILLIISLFAMTGMGVMIAGKLTSLTRNFMMQAAEKADSLAASEARTDAFLQSAVDQAIIATDDDGTVIKWNVGAELMFGYSSSEAIGQSLFAMVLPPQLPNFGNNNTTSLNHLKQKGSSVIPLTVKRKNGVQFDSVWALGHWFEEEVEFHSVIITDISERKAYEQKLYQQAHFDTTTHLLNRTGLIETLDDVIQHENQIALMLVSMSGLSDTNNSHGHLAGDRLIATNGQKLKSISKKGEVLARISACQFALIISSNVHDRCTDIRTQIDALFSHPTQVDLLSIHQEPSFGIAIKESEDLDANSLLNKAFVALSQAKETEQTNWSLYNQDYNAEAQLQATIVSELHNALMNEEFELFFQPQVDAKTGKCKGLEGLIRWNHPERGLLAPNDFINWAESTNLIVQVGDWALEEGCRIARTLIDLGYSDMTIAINVSPKQLYVDSLTNKVEALIKQYELPNQTLEIEVTESLLVSNVNNLHQKFADLHKLGVLLSMDDFGTGYSSLSYLQSINFDTLKIDKSFVDQVPQSEKGVRILKAIIDMSKALGLNVVTEGVETKEQSALIAELGGDLIQGYVNAKPMPFKVLVNWLEQNRLGR